jgi:hypothetical protein
MPDNSNAQPTVIAETDNFMIWTADDDEGETTYNLELGHVTLHLFKEEWEEFLKLIRAVKK